MKGKTIETFINLLIYFIPCHSNGKTKLEAACNNKTIFKSFKKLYKTITVNKNNIIEETRGKRKEKQIMKMLV